MNRKKRLVSVWAEIEGLPALKRGRKRERIWACGPNDIVYVWKPTVELMGRN